MQGGGDHFLTKTGKSATVVGLIIRMERVQVYNLQVKNLQLYAVGEAGVLVHNNSGNQRVLRDLVNEVTNKGHKPLSADDANTILKWGQEYNYPGLRASPADVGGEHWIGPHINMPGCGRNGHVPVAPGVTPISP